LRDSMIKDRAYQTEYDDERRPPGEAC
jgi:hypothetical protein